MLQVEMKVKLCEVKTKYNCDFRDLLVYLICLAFSLDYG